MTPDQLAVLPLINTINTDHFDDWFLQSSVMAVIQIESGFRQFARRFEPRINDASYGYMQLLSRTADSLHASGGTKIYHGPLFPNMPVPNPTTQPNLTGTLYDPAVNIRCGMTYLRQGWDHLARSFGRLPSLHEWFNGYNHGYDAVARGHDDEHYARPVLAAFEHWLTVLDEQQRAADLRRR